MQYCSHILIQKVILDFFSQLNILIECFIIPKRKQKQTQHTMSEKKKKSRNKQKEKPLSPL